MENIHVLHFRWVVIFLCVSFSFVELLEVSHSLIHHYFHKEGIHETVQRHG